MVIAGSRALASDLFDQVLSLLSSSFFRALFPHVRVTVDGMTIRTSAGGTISFSGFRQTQIGRGADLVVLDDPISPTDVQDEKKRSADGVRLRSEILPRFNDPDRGCLLCVSQRLHDDDISAQIRATATTCHTVSIPAIAVRDEEWKLRTGALVRRKKGKLIQPSRLSKQSLRSLLLSMGGHRFRSQYQQDTTMPFGSYGENRTGTFYYPKGHPLYRESFFGPAWFFAVVPETLYALHELFGEPEPPRRYDASHGPTAEEWQRVARVQQRMLVENCKAGKAPPTVREVRDEVAKDGRNMDG